MKKTIITLTTDFGLQSQGIANMEGVIAAIAPNARVIHLAHGLPDFNTLAAARTMEAVAFMPVGIHVCVVDPGVGTSRKPIIIKAHRGDFFIGPDNGIFPSIVNILGGATKVVTITNPKYMLLPISPIFHGRHIFAPAAAYLANGISLEQFGDEIKFNELVPAPYTEAAIEGEVIDAKVIWINKFGSLNLNILHSTWDKLKLPLKEVVTITVKGKRVVMPYVETFGQTKEHQPLVLKDDYGRIEIAINLGNFAQKYKVKIGDRVTIQKNSGS